MFSSGRDSFSDRDILERIPEENLAAFYLGVKKIPSTVSNPFRRDEHPSLGIYLSSNGRVRYRDFATGDRGFVLDLVCELLGIKKENLISQILLTDQTKIKTTKVTKYYDIQKEEVKKLSSDIQCKIRVWNKADIAYWESYGVPLSWLKWAEVYPITHTIITMGGEKYVFSCDPLAYSFVERKDGKVSMKIYQPLNKNHRKWLNKNDKSVIGLWTKVPPTGDKIVICSSLKDALSLSANTGIPAIYMQGEGYKMSGTAQENLKKRYKEIYILLDNDPPGRKYSLKLAEETGFKNLILPQMDGAKDVSDMYKQLNDKEKFKNLIMNLFV